MSNFISDTPNLEMRLEADTGEVQLNFMDRWGSICPDNWSDREASVVCRMLGHSDGHVINTTTIIATISDNESSDINTEDLVVASTENQMMWLDDMWCDGDEENIIDCTFRPVGRCECARDRGGAVRCT